MECGILCARPLITAFIERLGHQFSDLPIFNHHSLFWSPQLPGDKRQVWFFRWRHQMQSTGSSPSWCPIPTLLPRSRASLTGWTLSVYPWSLLTWKVLPWSWRWAVFSSLTWSAGCAQSNCCSCLSCFSSGLPSLSFSSKVQRAGLANTPWQVFMNFFLPQLRRYLPYPTFFPNKSSNKLGNLKTFIYAHKNNALGTVFTGLFLGYIFISAWS